MKIAYRHGDVLLFKVDEIPKTGSPVTTGILAYGEATGHTHRVHGNFDLFAADVAENQEFDVYGEDSAMLLRVHSAATISHEEHHAIEIPAGDYVVLIESEYEPKSESDPEGWHSVVD